MQSSRTFGKSFIASAVVVCLGACGSIVTPAPAAPDGEVHPAVGTGGTAGIAAGTGGTAAGTSVAGTRAAAAGQAARIDAPQGGSVAAADAGVPAECIEPLSRSGCPATYAEAIAPVDCSGGTPFGEMSTATCGTRRSVESFVVDVVHICLYDATGAVISSRTCSKPIGKCNCFYAGVMDDFGTCTAQKMLDQCEQDAGTN
jgi:hypothetical protein